LIETLLDVIMERGVERREILLSALTFYRFLGKQNKNEIKQTISH